MKIQDKYDVSERTFHRQKNKVKKLIAELLNSAICKLEIEFEKSKIIMPNC